MSETDSLMDDLLNGRIEYRDLTQEQRCALREILDADVANIITVSGPREADLVNVWYEAFGSLYESLQQIDCGDLAEKTGIINESKTNPDR